MNRENLETLAMYLEKGNLQADFDMAHYDDGSASCYGNHTWVGEPTNCGAVGCMVGHGPYAGIHKRTHERWSGYSTRVFGIPMHTSLWDWLFSHRWSEIDNTPQGGAFRIRYALSHPMQPVPQWFETFLEEHYFETFLDDYYDDSFRSFRLDNHYDEQFIKAYLREKERYMESNPFKSHTIKQEHDLLETERESV